MVHIFGCFPDPGLCKGNIIGMLRHSPVNISLGGNISVKLIQNVSRIIIGIILYIAVPLLIQGNINPCAAAHTLDRCIKYTEGLCIFLHIGCHIRMGHVVPFLPGIDLIGDHPV